MAKSITLNQLKYFLGTGLTLLSVEDNRVYIDEIQSIDQRYNTVITMDGHEIGIDELGIDEDGFTPLVRPMSDLIHWANCEEIGISNAQYDKINRGKELDFSTIKILTDNHYDIFGWIEDGLAQAKDVD